MNVLLCSAYYRDVHDVISGRSTWENLGIRYLASATSALDGVDVTLHDHHLYCRTNDQAMEMYAALPSQQVVGVSVLAHSLDVGLDLVRRIHQRTPQAKIVLGGFGATFWRDKILQTEPAVTAVFVGDAELSFHEFVRRLRDGQQWQASPGIAFRHNGSITETPLAEMADLDTLHAPLRDARYPLDECTISASRGCAYNCAFCSIVPFYRMQPGKKVRHRAPEAIVDEMAALQRDCGIRWINFTDDDFLGINRVCPGWSDRLADEMIRRDVKMRFFFQSRTDHVTEEGLAKLKEAGLRTVAYGVESYVPRMLKSFGKRVDKDQNRRAIDITKRLRINFELYSIAVDADSTIPEILADMDEFESLGYYDSNDPVPFSMQVDSFRAYPFRGSRLFQDYQQRGILRIDGFRTAYDFCDPLLAQLARICRDWNDRWRDVSDVILQYRYVPAIRLGRIQDATYYKRIHNTYFVLDAQWVRAVCRSLQDNNERNQQDLDAINADAAEGLEELRASIGNHDVQGQYTYDLYGGFSEP